MIIRKMTYNDVYRVINKYTVSRARKKNNTNLDPYYLWTIPVELNVIEVLFGSPGLKNQHIIDFYI